MEYFLEICQHKGSLTGIKLRPETYITINFGNNEAHRSVVVVGLQKAKNISIDSFDIDNYGKILNDTRI